MGKSYVESSLKKFLKRKVKITLGFVVTFMIMGTGVFAVNGPFVAVDGTNSLNGEVIEITGGAMGKEYGSVTNYGQVGVINGVLALNNGVFNLGDNNTQKIYITANGDWTMGLMADRVDSGTKGGVLKVTTNDLIINVHSTDYIARGIWAATRTTDFAEENVSKVILNTNNIVINASSDKSTSTGVTAWSQAQVIMNSGNVSITADNVIDTRGNSLIEINANNDSKNIINLNGNIIFAYDGVQSGTTIESGVNINLSNENSYLNGKITPEGNPPEGRDEVTGMTLGLSNGGKWKVTGDSFVNDLTMEGGVIEVTDAVKEIKADRLYGNSGIAMFAASMDGENVKVTEGQLKIGEVKEKTNLEVGFLGINADNLANIDLNKAFAGLKDKIEVTTETEKVEETYFAEEGKVTGKITAKDNEKGELVITQEKESKTVMGLKDLATINYLSWKQEMGSLTQRMGELRNSSAEHGVWARVYGGKVENGNQYNNEYQTYQVGYDKKYMVDNGRIYMGYLVSYTNGETDYSLGHGENYSVGAGIYATWMNNNGHYVDVLYKVSRLNNKFDVNSVNDKIGKSSGEYDTFGISLSAEYGKRFDFGEKWFVEPSVGMHLGQLGDETYTTDSEIEVLQDTIYTAEGRIGTTIGYKFSDKGNIYARTHIVKEFAGDIDAEYKAEGVTSKTSEDLSDTWFEFGIGTNYKFAENMNIYADIEKTGDSTVDTKWQANLGFRYEF